ncbi:MAG: DUF1329 domain-containing protein [Desulfobacterales bacterium]|jgi:hypothetical protein|nr:DUF1329 domain-containing protein [Desulfobacterales bacterium]
MRKAIAAIAALLFIGGALVLTPAAFCEEPAVGTKIGPDNWKQYEKYIPQSLSEQITRGQMTFEVGGDATKFVQPSSGYKRATEQNKGKAKIDANGAMTGWEAGRPFPDIDPKDPMAGFKIAYNLERRYEGDDQSLQAYQLINVDSKGQERYVTGTEYGWMWLSIKGRVDCEPLGEWAPNPKQIWRYNTLAIDFPYDIKGTSRLLIRYLDSAKDDDIWMYIPTMRRIRRMSGAQRQNNFVGTVCTYDDIRTFQGRPMEYDWKLIGEDRVLCAALDGKTPHPKNEKGFWIEPRSMRDCWIVEAVPRDKNYVYTKRLFWIDKECFVPWHENVFDVQGRTWKVCENYNAPIFMGEKADGELVVYEQSFIWLDLLDNTHTLLEYVGWDKDGKQTGKISTGQTREWYTIENIAKRGRRN